MSFKEIEKIERVALRAARKAGEYALAAGGRPFTIRRKLAYTDLVTDVDKACEKIIIGEINKNFPGHSILAEESGKKRGEGTYTWVVDPIDGTTNYAHAFPFYCVSIGVMEKGKGMVAGVVYDPTRDELFSATDGGGAFLNGSRIRVSKIDGIRDSMLATGFAYDTDTRRKTLPYFSRMLRHSQAVRRAGSAALDLCYVACGRFDGFWEFGLNPWDTAAGVMILEEAGGVVTDLRNGPFNIFKKEILATNGKIHGEMMRILNRP